jgi:hypothetical protein
MVCWLYLGQAADGNMQRVDVLYRLIDERCGLCNLQSGVCIIGLGK